MFMCFFAKLIKICTKTATMKNRANPLNQIDLMIYTVNGCKIESNSKNALHLSIFLL